MENQERLSFQAHLEELYGATMKLTRKEEKIVMEAVENEQYKSNKITSRRLMDREEAVVTQLVEKKGLSRLSLKNLYLQPEPFIHKTVDEDL